VLLTDVWLAPEPKAAKRRPPGPGGGRGKGGEGQAQAGQSWVDVWLAAQARSPGLGLDDGDETSEPADRQKQWATRQELRQLGLLRERPALSYDARTERYWGEVRRAQRLAAHAIIDPYTDLVAGFADAEPERIPELRVEAREYGRDAQALLALGRAYVAIGRIKSAQGAFRAAAAADPYYPEAWWHLGIAHLFTRANDKGARELEWAAELAPGDSRVEMGAALARYHLRDFAAAEGWFSRLAGSGGLRASARSMLACSVRMQAKWDQARVELGLLRQDRSGDWGALAAQCEDCVARGEERLSQTAMGHRRAIQMWKSLAATGAGGLWVVYSLAEDLFRKELRWALVPLFALALAAGRALKGISTRERAGEFGNAEQGLPCWQATTWVNPRRSEL
jgi:tetratricopeptide (TPR) repeat protein